MKTISAHFLVKNEEKFIWYSIMSVINHVDKVIIYDSGSSDNTKKIITEILRDEVIRQKIIFKDFSGEFDEAELRQKMLDETVTDWFIVVDGDEIWWDESIKKLTETIQEKGNELESIIVPAILPVGDMFYFQEQRGGRYKFNSLSGELFGHYSLRAVNRKIPGLSSDRPHGQWGWIDIDGKMIQDRDPKKIGFINTPYIHVTHLQRAGTKLKDSEVLKRTMKLKYEIGISFSRDFYYPEVFFRDRPNIVESPWTRMPMTFKLWSIILTPLRKLKRRYLGGRIGY